MKALALLVLGVFALQAGFLLSISTPPAPAPVATPAPAPAEVAHGAAPALPPQLTRS